MAGRYWFKPKSFGYGATPTTWQGWASVLVFVLAVVGLSGAILGSAPGASEWMTWLAALAALTLGFAAFTKQRTDGDWRWRWRRRRIDAQ